jgi:glycosyltransferase involved in cell wall biosynthesis
MKGLLVCPSYKRPGRVETRRLFPNIEVWVAESEAEAYRAESPTINLKTMPDKVQGNIARVRNWILDRADADAVCIVDDDLQYIGCFQADVLSKIENEAMMRAFLCKYTQMAIDLETPLWGININMDKQCYREYTPFSFTSVVLAPFMVHISPVLRFDETIPLKEDYDFCIQTLNRYRKILRVNRFHYVARQGASTQSGMKQAGGCAEMRSVDEERRQLGLLRKKWGDKIVQLDPMENSRSHKSQKEKRFDINPVIRIPIMGV